MISALTSLNNVRVDGAYVFELSPTPSAGVGVSSNLGGIVGGAGWGQLNVPTGFSDTGSLYAIYGPVTTDNYSLVAEGYFATYSNNNFVGVRVSDGTDTAATVQIKDSGGTVVGITLTAFYTGTEGNTIKVTDAPGSLSTAGSPTRTVTIQRGTYQPEVYPNIPAPTTGAYWVNLKNAINTGVGAANKLPSALVTATIGTSVLGPVVAQSTYTLAGGTNGMWGSMVTISGTTGSGPTVGVTLNGVVIPVYTYQVSDSTATIAAASIAAYLNGNSTFKASYVATASGPVVSIAPLVNGAYTITTQVNGGAVATVTSQPGAGFSAAGSTAQIGTDSSTGAARTGMYALRATGVDTFILAGNSDATVYGTQATLAQQEAALALCALPSGTAVTTALSTKQTSGPTSASAALVKDWIYFYDQANQQSRLVSPLGEVLGLIVSLPPWVSPSNKPYVGFGNITNTERSISNPPYSYSDASAMSDAGITWISKGISRSGSLFGMANGRNSLAVPGQDDIAYTRMTNYVAKSINNIIGQVVGDNQTMLPNDATRQNVKSLLDGFFYNLSKQGAIQAWNVTCDLTNNTTGPSGTIAQGFCIASVAVQYMNVIRYMVAYLQGGSTVQVKLAQAA